MNEYRYEDLSLGHTEHYQTTITEDLVTKFKELSGDLNPLHTNDSYAKLKGNQGRVVYGMLTASFLSTFAGMYLPGKYSLIHSVDVKFLKPLYVDIDTPLTITGEVVRKDDLFKLLTLKVTMVTDSGIKVCKATMKVGVLSE
ncbi:MAG: MaoC/PaaZ C-terminal domain-containing protein [Eubacteriales bacterium]